MKNINLHFTDKEYKSLQKLKGKRTWREFLLSLIEDVDREENKNHIQSDIDFEEEDIII